jgi:hypothetical protein
MSDTDKTDMMQRYEAEWHERGRLTQQARPINKAALFAALAQADITVVIVSFDGAGDSGQIENIFVTAGDTEGVLPSVMIEFTTVNGQGELSSSPLPIREAIESLVYELLGETHGGWENNDGAYGEFRFDVTERSIELEFYQRFTDAEFFEHSF